MIHMIIMKNTKNFLDYDTDFGYQFYEDDSERPNVRFRFGSSAELGGSARFGRTTEPADFTEPEPN